MTPLGKQLQVCEQLKHEWSVLTAADEHGLRGIGALGHQSDEGLTPATAEPCPPTIQDLQFQPFITAMQAVLICGWQDTPFMLELLTDLDRGVDKLPRGSEVVLLNMP